MTTKELIREKIDSFYAEYKAKFHQNGEPYNLGIIDGLDMAERILDTLPDEPSCPISDGWKPTEAQMNGLAHAINLDVYDAERYGLDSLYNDLKKLM